MYFIFLSFHIGIDIFEYVLHTGVNTNKVGHMFSHPFGLFFSFWKYYRVEKSPRPH